MTDYSSTPVDVGTGPAGTNGDTTRGAFTKLIADIAQIFAGLAFDSTTNVVRAINGIKIGGNGSENLLAIYEEGTFTPTLQDASESDAEGQTYSIQTGFHTKIGNVVHFKLRISLSSLGTLTVGDSAKIAGLPFVSSSAAQSQLAITVGLGSGLNLPSAGMSVAGNIAPSSTNIDLLKWSSTGGTTGLLISEVTAAGQLYIAGSYFV